MEYRNLGNTGLKTSLLGFGGFHLLEIPQKSAETLLNEYLDAGGNYIETAASYGDGESERKIGASVSKRRGEYILVSKISARDKAGAARQIERTLRNLRTDHVDILLMHGVASPEDFDTVLEGPYQAALEAQAAGKARHIGGSMHGWPGGLIEALNRGYFDVVMSTVNYFDRCNYPEIENTLLPLAHGKGAGVILMKPLADGWLYKNADAAFRYAFSRPVSVVVTGINNEKMLRDDLKRAESYKPMTVGEETELLASAPELSGYVCRQCGKCACPLGIDIQEIFAAEGYYDRQMARGVVTDTADYALMERLRFWFGQAELGRARYNRLEKQAGACDGCGACLAMCPYGIDIPAKLALADYKLAGREMY
ncbi:MAG: aldo/keto reductase [Defluviitaleaceae bacterium]|nr:aldo/keto reductase [Defluviitaleaceae bacterium]